MVLVRLYLWLRRQTVDAPFHPPGETAAAAIYYYKTGDTHGAS